MPIQTHARPEYDAPTAVTFLLAGIAAGALLTFIFSPLALNSKLVLRSKLRPFLSSGKTGEPVLYE
jgi:hypothetical protein